MVIFGLRTQCSSTMATIGSSIRHSLISNSIAGRRRPSICIIFSLHRWMNSCECIINPNSYNIITKNSRQFWSVWTTGSTFRHYWNFNCNFWRKAFGVSIRQRWWKKNNLTLPNAICSRVGFTASCLISPIQLTDDCDDADVDAVLGTDERGMNFKRLAIRSPRMQKKLRALIPKFECLGVFDCEWIW